MGFILLVFVINYLISSLTRPYKTSVLVTSKDGKISL